MKIIKIVDFLADRFCSKCRGDIFTHKSLGTSEALICVMKERLTKLEKENIIEKDFKKLSKEQEIKFIENLILRLESKND